MHVGDGRQTHKVERDEVFFLIFAARHTIFRTHPSQVSLGCLLGLEIALKLDGRLFVLNKVIQFIF